MTINKKEKKKIHFKRNLKEYLNIASTYKSGLSILILSVIITEALFIADKFLFKKLIDDAELFSTGVIAQSVLLQTIFIIVSVYILIVIFRAAGKWFSGYLLAKLEPKLIVDLKRKYFSHIVTLSHKFHSEHKTGSLISRLNRGSYAIEGMTDILTFQIGPFVLQLILVFTSIALFSIKPAISLVIMSALFISYSIFLQNRQKRHQVTLNDARDKESGFISDTLTNIESIKYFGKESRIDSRFKVLVNDTAKKSFKYWGYFPKMNLGQNLIIGFGLLGLLYFPLIQFLNGEINIGTIVFIYALYGNVVGNLFQFTYGIRNFYKIMGDFEDLFQYGEIENEVKDIDDAKNLKIKNGEIEFNNVTFGYSEKDKRKDVFKNFNLKIKPNEKIAFVGHSGSGKTSLVKLINRLYDVDSGKILIDNKDIKNFTQQSVRSETSIVPQECILFDDTIYNNILFASPGAKRKDVMKAIKQAQLLPIIKKLPNKEKTIVGERGVKLSGGEKQRVSIARAILANKKILILDEATSALDSRTENSIQKALSNLLRSRTSIIVAHRLSTIMNSDRIIVLKDGKIVEEGNHEDLVKKKGEYASLWDLQSSGYIQE